ncbi:hypothetical protein ACMHYB_48550 [Sorangium sp. So ce1128]
MLAQREAAVSHLRQQPLLKKLLDGVLRDEEQERRTLSLTAYENRISCLARRFLTSPLADRYHLGLMEEHGLDEVVQKGDLMFKGLPGVYALESSAQDAMHRLFGAAVADLRPLSGVHAMISTLGTATKPGDLVLSIAKEHGGHFATQHILARMGRRGGLVPWDVARFTCDLDRLARLVRRRRPQAIFFDQGAPLFPLPLLQIREIVGPECLLIYDASHTLGLIAGGAFQRPLQEGCDILQGNSHKSFPGPQKAFILFRDGERGAEITESISSGFVSSQHTHHAMAQYITLLEMSCFAEDYARQLLSNTRALAEHLQRAGFPLAGLDGVPTRTHILLLPHGTEAQMYEACRRLLACNIATNARYCYGMPVLRLGTQEITRRGMKEVDMEYIALLLKRALLDRESVKSMRLEVSRWNKGFPNVHYSFDRELGYWREAA